MNEELTTYEVQPIDIIRPPTEILQEAHLAAKALAEVVKGKKKPVIFNDEQYLEFEDWQTIGKFYGLSAKVTGTEYIEYGSVHGFTARAITLNRYGMEISAAESLCMSDEPNWKMKPLFQLKSMAQTRACAKTLRNVLAWVVVLAGYRPTPAEEMDNLITKKPEMKEPGEKKLEDITSVLEIRKKTGKGKTGKDFIIYTIKGEENEYSTFSETFAITAKEAKEAGKKVTITFNTDQYGNKAENVIIYEPSEPMPDMKRVITEKNRKDFLAFAQEAGKTDNEIKAYLLTLGIEHSADVPYARFEEVCKWAQTKEQEREAGEEG